MALPSPPPPPSPILHGLIRRSSAPLRFPMPPPLSWSLCAPFRCPLPLRRSCPIGPCVAPISSRRLPPSPWPLCPTPKMPLLEASLPSPHPPSARRSFPLRRLRLGRTRPRRGPPRPLVGGPTTPLLPLPLHPAHPRLRFRPRLCLHSRFSPPRPCLCLCFFSFFGPASPSPPNVTSAFARPRRIRGSPRASSLRRWTSHLP